MKAAFWLVAAGAAAVVAYRLYQASKFGVPLSTAIAHPFVPIGALQPPNVRAAADVKTRLVTIGPRSF